MARAKRPAARAEPRLPEELQSLTAARLPAEDDEWEDVEISGEVEVVDTVERLEIRSSRLVGVTLTGARIDWLAMVDVELVECELSGLWVGEGSLRRVTFDRCRLRGAALGGITGADVRFVDCRLTEAGLRMTKWERLEMDGCDLRDAELNGASLVGARLLGCDLTNVELSGARCAGAALHGSTIERLRGAEALAGARIGADQLVPVGVALLGAHRIEVTDGPDPDDG